MKSAIAAEFGRFDVVGTCFGNRGKAARAAAASRLSRLILRSTTMPEHVSVSKPALALPLPASVGSVVPQVASLPKATRGPAVAQARAVAQTPAAVQAREDRITHYFFLAYMALTVLGVAAMGFALLTM